MEVIKVQHRDVYVEHHVVQYKVWNIVKSIYNSGLEESCFITNLAWTYIIKLMIQVQAKFTNQM